MAYDEVKRVTPPSDEVLSQALATAEMWCDGQADTSALQSALGSVEAWLGATVPGHVSLWACVWDAVAYAATGGDLVPADRWPEHWNAVSDDLARMDRRPALWNAAAALTLLGEPMESTWARVEALYASALREARERAARQDGHR